MALSRRVRLFAYLAKGENAFWLLPILFLSVVCVAVVNGILSRWVYISPGWLVTAIPVTAVCLMWGHLKWREAREVAVIAPLSSAQRGLAAQLWGISLDEARERAENVLKRAWSRPVRQDLPAESLSLVQLLHPSLRELFERYDAVCWHDHSAIGWGWLNRLRSHPQFLRVGIADPGGVVTLVVKPHEPDVYQLDSINAKTLQFSALTHFASIYHLMLFENQFCMCPTCKYDLRETPNRCPECGALFPENVPVHSGARASQLTDGPTAS